MELGQMLFSNSPIPEYEADWASTGIIMLAEYIQEMRGDSYPLSSNGGEVPYESDIFDMRTYCWCDGDREGHENGCPPNFKHHDSGLILNWYKHCGRGITSNKEINQEITKKEWFNILQECMDSLGEKQ